MKKLVTIFAVLCVVFSLNAGFDYRLDVISTEPLHEGYMADKDSPSMAFNYIYNFEGYPDHVYQDSPNNDVPIDPEIFDFDYKIKSAPWMGQIKVGGAISLLRNTFSFDSFMSPISFDFTAQGMINFLFEGGMADMMSYDGVYFIGAQAGIADRVSMRFGIHHYCNHYGDAIIKVLRSRPNWSKFWPTYKYVRMDGMVFGLSVRPIENIRIYGEYNWLPKNIDSWRPTMFRPNFTKHENRIAGLPDSYKARIINVGVELSYPIFRSLGNTTIAYDLHMYEEGKIVYKDENGVEYTDASKIHYDENAPWILEHAILINQEINDSVSFEIAYHYGRTPSNLFYFMENASWMYIGARYTPGGTVTAYDSAR